MPTLTVREHFQNRAPIVAATYAAVLAAARALGPMEEDPKKTSIHLVRRTAFAGVATRKDALILTLKSAADLASPRVRKRQRLSANRWYIDIKLDAPNQVDRELRDWIAASYELSS
jgi:hypothetical protein